MDHASLKRLSKQMALLLRHAPERAGLILDPEGFVPIDHLVSALKPTMPDVNATWVHQVVETVEPHKQRYAIVEGCVRANYGHSTGDLIQHPAAQPPDVLFHGTGVNAVSEILVSGLKPMGRQYVHLTPDPALAASVGARHGSPRIIRVDARSAHRGGIRFHKANATFWLAAAVPAAYLQVQSNES